MYITILRTTVLSKLLIHISLESSYRHIQCYGFTGSLLIKHVHVVTYSGLSESRPRMIFLKALLGLSVVMIHLLPTVSAGGDCFDSWSLCTTATYLVNGVAHLDCPKKCICDGYATGQCELTPSCYIPGGGYQCKCSGFQNQHPWYCTNFGG